MFGLGERCLDDLLRFGRSVCDEGSRAVGCTAGGDQPFDDVTDMFQSHVKDENLGTAGEGRPVELVGHIARQIMAGHEGHSGCRRAVGHGNAGIGEPADRGGHAGHDVERDVGGDQRERFLTTTPEQERVATLQAQDAFALACQGDQAGGNIRLSGRWLATAFAGINQRRVCLGEGQNTVIHQRVVDHHVGRLQGVQRAHRQQGRITRPGAHEPDPAGLERRKIEFAYIHTTKLAPDRWPGNLAGRYDRVMSDVPDTHDDQARPPSGALRRGWTTGACAAAAAKAAYEALLTGRFPDPVAVRLPRGLRATFPLAETRLSEGRAYAAVIKDAGDDPDVTHGAQICSTVTPGRPGSGICFAAGEGVGTVTLPGLPVPPGEPAINPKPREMIAAALQDVAGEFGVAPDVLVTVSIPGGEALAERTANSRLGIVGGLSVLGTTGVVIPYSCASWVHSIHRGVDVARATGMDHLAGATGRTSEAAVQAHHALADRALIDMGDFAGALLKYVRAHPVPRLSIAGGFGKLSKLADGHMDLHSSRSSVDVGGLADRLAGLGASPELVAQARSAVSAGAVLGVAADAGLEAGLAEVVALGAREVCRASVAGATDIDVLVAARDGRMLAYVGP